MAIHLFTGMLGEYHVGKCGKTSKDILKYTRIQTQVTCKQCLKKFITKHNWKTTR